MLNNLLKNKSCYGAQREEQTDILKAKLNVVTLPEASFVKSELPL
jgi:hypothetical protein